ncbi:MAG: DUF2141 domain-containing protein [Deltaproteobacteria bacterium]|nr:DUF2141 domain-containing protein [Deltaproteobacteria bacterium]
MSETAFEVTIKNIKKERGGQLIVFLFYEEGFPKNHEKSKERFIFQPTAAQIKVEIQVPQDKRFALKVLHDENKDGKVTKNWTGFIPRDGMGFSNGARIRFGPPAFDKAHITYKKQPQTITMKYF